MIVPNFKGITDADAKELAVENVVIIGTLNYDEEPSSEADKALYYIYDQDPQDGDVHKAGKRINLWLSKDKNHKPRQKTSDDEDFFN